MNYFEIICKCFIKQDIFFKDSFEIIAKYINYTLFQEDKYSDIHYNKDFKPYCFNSFYPTEQQDKIYKKGDIYTLKIRSIYKDFAYDLAELLRNNVNNFNFLIVETEIKTVEQFFITELYTVTPTIITIDNKPTYWTYEKSGDITLLMSQLHDNLEKKYQYIYNQPISAANNFIQFIQIKNKKPKNIYIGKHNKPITFFGNKFKIVPNEDEISQRLAFIALSCGLGEKQSYGGGFCTVKGI